MFYELFNTWCKHRYKISYSSISPFDDPDDTEHNDDKDKEISNLKNKDWKIAQIELEQTERLYELATLEVTTQVKQAYNLFKAHEKQIHEFNTGLLDKAKAVLNGKTYSYKRGDTALLEVLDAQRTYNEVQEEYYETIYNYLAALVEVERTTGTWNVIF